MTARAPHNPLRLSRRSFLEKSLLAAASPLLSPAASALAPRNAARPSRWINPLIGASTSSALGEGKTFPGPATPFGMVQLGPDTFTGGDNAPGYSWEHPTIEGFSFTRMSGVGWYGDFGNLQIMPTTGPLQLDSGRVDRPGEGWRSRWSHATERAEANYYAVTLDKYRIRTELTAAPRAGILRFTFPPDEQRRIQFNLARRIAGTSTRQSVKVVDERAIEGWMRCPATGGGWGNGAGHVGYTVYFRAEFSQPLTRFGVWEIDVPGDAFPVRDGLTTDYFASDSYRRLVERGQVREQCSQYEGNHIGFYAEFPPSADALLVKAGISFVGIDGARANLQHDIAGWDFDAVRHSGAGLWDEALSCITIEGATADQQHIFYTALYHAMIDPRIIADADGRYTAANGEVMHASRYARRTVFSGWDVFRGAFPLMTLLDPAMVSDEINSLVALAEESGKGYLERWEIMNAYSGCMDGDPAISVICDAWHKGIRGFDIDKAWNACRQTAAGTGAATNRPDNEFYINHGYVSGQVSWSLDNYYFDWCLSRLASSLGKSSDAETFVERSRNYRKIYDPAVGSMRARDASGNWIPWKGKTTFGQGCTESNPGQQTWFVPHDVHGLIELMGGPDRFSEQLEAFFEKTPPSFAWNDYYNHSNEPVHHVPYLFVYAGKPWLTQKWVRRILLNAYRNEVNGICGNDDVGQMSAWYVLGALGFYPVCPGDGLYILGSPLFAQATITVDHSSGHPRTFSITAENQAPDHPYIQSAALNGKPLGRSWIRHAEIAAGGTLSFRMGAVPNQHWASSQHNLPPSAVDL